MQFSALRKSRAGADGAERPVIFLRTAQRILRAKPVDNIETPSLYKPSWRAAAWRDGASWKPLTVRGESSGHELWPCRMCGLRRLPSRFSPRRGSRGRRSRKVPGCLTSESEERETWTAESLRTASSNGEGFGLFSGRARSWKRLRRSTFQVNTMIVTVSNHRNGQSGTSSNVVICREKVLIQLESLILAQSERWRQA